MTYPSGLAITNYYNAAGRPTQINCANSYPTCPSYPYALAFASGATYTPNGALATLVLGYSSSFSGINLSKTYNSRLQPVNMAATHTSDSTTLLSLSYSYAGGGGYNNGTVQSDVSPCFRTRGSMI
jgi:hypothetical protein